MVRLVGFVVFCSLVFSGQAQISFFGKPQAVSSLNSSSGEQYLFVDYEAQRAFFGRVKDKGNVGGKKDPSDIWSGNLDGSGEVNHWILNDEQFAAPIGKRISGEFWLFNKVKFDKGNYYGGVYAVNSDGESFREIDIPYFKNKSPIQTGCLSVDNKFLILSLENNLSYGVDDLFVCALQGNGTWGAPKNLSNVVNTKNQEITPFLAEDNKTLFFASNGHGGEGSFDLFMSERLDDTWQNWTQPENLGPLINTSGAESSFSFKKGQAYAYFISTQNSDGYGDIKKIRIQADSIETVSIDDKVTLRVFEYEPKVVKFLIKDKRSELPIKGAALVFQDGDTLRYPANNEGIVAIPMDGESLMEFKADGYLSSNKLITESLQQQLIIEIALEPLSTGNTITLENVLFYRTTANFVEGSLGELDLVVEMMQENPEVKIFLKGHTDNVGNETLNEYLSKERVMAVKEYLVEHGVGADRITGEGFGGSQPIASNDSEETRKLNRRVEFEVIRE